MTQQTARPQMHRDSKGFDFEFETPISRSFVSVRFDFVLFAPPLSFEMSFRPARESGLNSFILHPDARGLDIVIGARQFSTDIPVPMEGVLSVRFMQRLEAPPIDGTFEIQPKEIPHH